MAVFELPLEELYSYAGRNPKPADFDAYWAAAINELDESQPAPELVLHSNPARFAECFDLWFDGVGGARLHAQYLRPRLSPPHPVIIRFHGYSQDAGDWFDKLAWVAQGFAVAALDVRGQGGLSEDPGGVKGTTLRGHIIRGIDDSTDRLFFRQVFLDTVQLTRVVMDFPEVDSSRVATFGGSQGGGLSIACAALEPRVNRAVSIYPFLSDYQRVWELDLAQDAYAELGLYFRQFDPTHEKEEAVFTRLGYIDVQHLANRIEARVLMAIGLRDTICPPSTQFAVFNKIRSAKELVLYPDYGHEAMPRLSDRTFEFLADI